MKKTQFTFAVAVLMLVTACAADDTDAAAVVGRAERITVDLAALIDDSPGIASTVRYACSADPALQVAETNLTAAAAQVQRDTAVAMSSFLESEDFDTTLINGGAGSDDIVLRASDFELTIDVHFSPTETQITATTDCLRSG